MYSKEDWAASAQVLPKDRAQAIDASRSTVFGNDSKMNAEMAASASAISALKIPIDGSLKQLGRYPTAFLHQFFDEQVFHFHQCAYNSSFTLLQRNDYGPHGYIIDDSIELHYRGPAFDRPKDIRARSFIAIWKDGERPPEIASDQVVMRVTMSCMGNCTEASSNAESEDEIIAPPDVMGGDDDDDDDENGPSWSDVEMDGPSVLTGGGRKGSRRKGGGRKGGRPKKHRRECSVKLIVSDPTEPYVT